MRIATKSLILIMVGAILGNVFTLFIAPNIITWYQTTSDPNAMCNCVTTAHNTTRTLVQAQAIGAALGGLLSFVLGLLIFRRRKAPPAAPAKS